MKRVLLAISVGLFSMSAFAASPRIFEEVLRSEAFYGAVGGKASVESITKIQTYRCVGCYLFQVRYYKQGDYDKIQTVNFFTKAKNLDGDEIEVTIKP